VLLYAGGCMSTHGSLHACSPACPHA
jgi:hypothetical protein